MPTWIATVSKWIAVALLWLTSGIAGQGLTLACYARNRLTSAGHLQVAQLSPSPGPSIQPAPIEDVWYDDRLPEYLGQFGVMLVWFLMVGAFYLWVRKNKLGLAMTVIPLSAFGVSALGAWNYAWPVCNAF